VAVQAKIEWVIELLQPGGDLTWKKKQGGTQKVPEAPIFQLVMTYSRASPLTGATLTEGGEPQNGTEVSGKDPIAETGTN